MHSEVKGWKNVEEEGKSWSTRRVFSQFVKLSVQLLRRTVMSPFPSDNQSASRLFFSSQIMRRRWIESERFNRKYPTQTCAQRWSSSKYPEYCVRGERDDRVTRCWKLLKALLSERSDSMKRSTRPEMELKSYTWWEQITRRCSLKGLKLKKSRERNP